MATTNTRRKVRRWWFLLIADHGLAGACAFRPELLSGINTRAGKLTCRPVAEAHGLAFTDPATLLD
jgi:alanine dehydrogenase